MSEINTSPVGIAPQPAVLPVVAADGAKAELILLSPDPSPRDVMFWIPAMGVPAKHYLPLAESLADRDMAVVLHEWRGIGSSDRRAGYQSDWAYRDLLEVDLPASMAIVRSRWPQARIWVGGHSLGGQLACLYASLHPQQYAGIALVASGSPYWRSYPWGRALAVSFLLAPLVAKLFGYLPGRRLKFAGNEARGLIADWARSGRTGRYVVKNMSVDFEQHLSALRIPLLALSMHDDWLGPAASMRWLLSKMPAAPKQSHVLTEDDMDGKPADHFSWMKNPTFVAMRIVDWMAECTDVLRESAADGLEAGSVRRHV